MSDLIARVEHVLGDAYGPSDDVCALIRDLANRVEELEAKLSAVSQARHEAKSKACGCGPDSGLYRYCDEHNPCFPVPLPDPPQAPPEIPQEKQP